MSMMPIYGKKCSNDNLVYVIWGNPIPLARAKMGKTRVWDSQKHLKLDWQLRLEEQHGDKELYSGPLILDIKFYMPMPEAISQRKKDLMSGCPHQSKPHISLFIDFIQKVCINILYKDDCQIAQINAKKIYDCMPRTELRIIEIRS